MSFCTICFKDITKKLQGINCSGFCKKSFHYKCLNIFNTVPKLMWKCPSCRHRTYNDVQVTSDSDIGMTSSRKLDLNVDQETQNRPFDILNQLKEELLLLHLKHEDIITSIQFCSSKLCDFQKSINQLDKLVKNFDLIVKENETLNKRVAGLEMQLSDIDRHRSSKFKQENVAVGKTVSTTGPKKYRGPNKSNSTSLNSDKKRSNSGSTNEQGTSSQHRRKTSSSFSFSSEKLKYATMKIDETFGGSHLFNVWSQGSAMKLQHSKDSNPKTEIAERDVKLDGECSKDSDSLPQLSDNSTLNPTPTSTDAPSVRDSETLICKIKNIIEEYLNDGGFRDTDEEIKTSISSQDFPQLVYNGYILVLSRSHDERNKVGCLFAYLIKAGTLSTHNYCSGLKNVLTESQKVIIDNPEIWSNMAELLVPLLCENVVTFCDMYNCLLSIVKNGHVPKILVRLFNLIIKEKGPNFLQSSWKSSQQKFSDYMQESKVDAFLKENSFEFMIGNANSQLNPNHSSLSYDEIHDKLLSFFQEKVSFDDVNNWINVNVGESKMGNQFIRTLTTAILNYAIDNKELKDENFVGKYLYLNKFCNNITQYKLQCLYAVQAFLHKLEYPKGLLLQIFNKLYEDNIISNENFLSWELSNDPAEQEGKDVALKQLTCFFTQLKEVDEGSSDEEEAASGV